MLLSDEISGFFETISALDCLHSDSYQGKIAYKATTVGWMWPRVPSHMQTGWSGVGMITIKIIHNKRLIKL